MSKSTSSKNMILIRAEVARIREKYPNRIPVIVEKTENKLGAEKAIFIFVDNMLPPTGAIMSAIYEEKKDEDGFLYVTLMCAPH
ncbi:hypothetical protein Q3G72_030923 [Acer saccharum]|nr:hypothetical protein Q3G72_030923 [Acer saccharum]